MDFISEQLADGRRIRVLNIVDEYSREVVGQYVDVAISGHPVARFLDELRQYRQQPEIIVCDNGPEFTSKVMFFWSKEKGEKLAFIQSGKPTQNAYVESLKSKLRNEYLNQHWFRTVPEARYEIDQWETITIMYAHIVR